MKTQFRYRIPFIITLFVFLGSCDKDEESATYKMICCEWTVTDIQFEVTISDVSLKDYFIDTYNLTEEEAEAAVEENENAYRDSWTGTMQFNLDGTYEFNVGGEFYTNNWFLSDDEKTINVFFVNSYMDFTIISISENKMELIFDQVYYVDINDDGRRDAIDYSNNFTLEK